MSLPVELARWQFAATTIFHFFFVPVTIGLSVIVAVMQTLAYRHRRDTLPAAPAGGPGDIAATGQGAGTASQGASALPAGEGGSKAEQWMALSRFFGRLLLINLAVGVVTGIVLEFQFGMNWSSYSVFVGNIFGAPLAIEGLLAFFLESTFVGLWVFGRDKLPPLVHLLTIWATSLGTVLSAFFILAANSWMQHPVGYKVVAGSGGKKAVLTDFWAVLRNSTLWASFFHTVTAAFVTGGALVLVISLWHVKRNEHRAVFARAARFALVFSLASVLVTCFAGDTQGRLMETQQPMKMASAEAIYDTANGASFSLITIGNLSSQQPVFQIRVPHMLSMIADLSWDGQVKGIDQIQTAETAKYGKGSYVPVLWITYWSFRLMVGAGFLLIVLMAWGIFMWRRRRLDGSVWFYRAAIVGAVLPFLANTTGWIFTEAGRQPWLVYGLMRTVEGVSPGVSTADVLATLVGFVAIYSVLGAIDAVLMVRSARRALDEPEEHEPAVVPGLVY
ncbi:MAG TPA: cytochrome ubiquinol oxidase subunit I [Acidimicrobiales bacterium]|nr:cytochrome ubiquinol oxidase subunit I [Acidimicrobiales bacterium]